MKGCKGVYFKYGKMFCYVIGLLTSWLKYIIFKERWFYTKIKANFPKYINLVTYCLTFPYVALPVSRSFF